jgi:hypothetical protein
LIKTEANKKKRLRLYRANGKSEAVGDPVFETDNDALMKSYRRRIDWLYVLKVDGKWLGRAATSTWMG